MPRDKTTTADAIDRKSPSQQINPVGIGEAVPTTLYHRVNLAVREETVRLTRLGLANTVVAPAGTQVRSPSVQRKTRKREEAVPVIRWGPANTAVVRDKLGAGTLLVPVSTERRDGAVRTIPWGRVNTAKPRDAPALSQGNAGSREEVVQTTPQVRENRKRRIGPALARQLLVPHESGENREEVIPTILWDKAIIVD
mmetsp:Transcript_102160/g.153052  ORF Transcript_102160/g.153052 Transcript_102160/m.153052 type:complete len:197 (+) Transcript_102160:960-1550(+)